MAITGPVIVRAADGMQWQASHREAEIGAVSTRPSTLFGFADKEAGISLRASYRTSIRDFHSPRHKHTFDQVRYILSGAVKYGRDVHGPETCLYLPEGVSYGPMQSYEDSVRTSVGLQFPGPSRIPYPTSADIARAREELSKLGKFEKGIFAWSDGRKQDSFEAIAERLMGEELSYPAPRYKDYVVMNAENYDWRPLQDTSGVFVKHLGYFNEVGPTSKSYGWSRAQVRIRAQPPVNRFDSLSKVKSPTKGRHTTQFHACTSQPTNLIPQRQLVRVPNCS